MPEKKMPDIPDYKIDWKKSALHNDQEIMRELIFAMLRLYLMDYQMLGEKESVFQWKGHQNAYRNEVCYFFNSDWFETILSVYFPDCEQEAVCAAIKKNQKTYRTNKL